MGYATALCAERTIREVNSLTDDNTKRYKSFQISNFDTDASHLDKDRGSFGEGLLHRPLHRRPPAQISVFLLGLFKGLGLGLELLAAPALGELLGALLCGSSCSSSSRG